MTNTETKSKTWNVTPYVFFKQHAGYCWNPKTETPAQGRAKCARALARAERKARAAGMTFQWDLDGETSHDWEPETEPARPTAYCVALLDGEPVGSLWSIDTDLNTADPYRRVVEAELALIALSK